MKIMAIGAKSWPIVPFQFLIDKMKFFLNKIYVCKKKPATIAFEFVWGLATFWKLQSSLCALDEIQFQFPSQ